MIYLDHNATTPVKPPVIDEMTRVMEIGGNPSSVHGKGRAAKTILENARQTIATQINCRPQKIIFTGGGTETNNIALKAAGFDHLILSITEHDSINGIEKNFTGTIDWLPVDQNGLIAPDILETAVKQAPEKTLVSIMLANNETGVIQDIAALSSIAHKSGTMFHTDAIQAFGKIPVDFRALGVDMLSLSAHKMGGPQGVGALIALEKIDMPSITTGGGQEAGRRAGTENLAGIAGFAKAAELVPENLSHMPRIKELRDQMEQRIKDHAPNVIFYGAGANRLPNTSTILMPGVSSETQVMAFDLAGICVSAGSACSSGKVKPSHVVTAMGADTEQALSTLRVSLGWNSRAQDVEAFIAAWIKFSDRKKQ
ncbi:MAG TPA: cysteine desulfurase [Sphingomonadales bacterium]|nr:cysteine desulfurase [Sphingomonadales bacterium]